MPSVNLGLAVGLPVAAVFICLVGIVIGLIVLCLSKFPLRTCVAYELCHKDRLQVM